MIYDFPVAQDPIRQGPPLVCLALSDEIKKKERMLLGMHIRADMECPERDFDTKD